MKLTKEQAIDYSIELWEWLAKTGKYKHQWPKWGKLGYMRNECPLCEYVGRDKNTMLDCSFCPIDEGYMGCYRTAYRDWEHEIDSKMRKKYAKLFLEQLRSLKE